LQLLWLFITVNGDLLLSQLFNLLEKYKEKVKTLNHLEGALGCMLMVLV